jgi:hypothetical protein
MFGRKLMGNRGNSTAQQRSTVMTTSTDFLSIDASVSAEDVAVPAGFKLKS